MSERRTVRPQLALEMTMREVLGNMEEMVGEYAFRDMGSDLEIIAIEVAEPRQGIDAESRAPNIRELFSAEIQPLPLAAVWVA